MIKEGVFISIRTPLLVTNMAFSLLASLLTQNTSYQLEIKVTKVCYFGMPRQHLKILQFNLKVREQLIKLINSYSYHQTKWTQSSILSLSTLIKSSWFQLAFRTSRFGTSPNWDSFMNNKSLVLLQLVSNQVYSH